MSDRSVYKLPYDATVYDATVNETWYYFNETWYSITDEYRS